MQPMTGCKIRSHTGGGVHVRRVDAAGRHLAKVAVDHIACGYS
jgi:hypothetical protein